MVINTIEDGRALLSSLESIPVGVGMTAYSRIIPASLFDRYYILCLRKTRDLSHLRKRAEVFCLEEETGGVIQKKGVNSEDLLAHPLTRDYLKDISGTKGLLLYQSYPGLEELAAREGWVLLANPASLRIKLNGRGFFRELVRDLALPEVTGGIYPIEDLLSNKYQDWARTLGKAFVIQLLEIVQGGGRGTFFVKSSAEYNHVCKRLQKGTWRGTRLYSFSASRLISGITISMTLCLTRHGVLLSGPQRQLTDLSYCRDLPESGIFCGHVWGEPPCSNNLKKLTRMQATHIGQYLKGMGYKGIVGIDFAVDEGEGKVFPLEINPRLTGAFPMLSQLHMNNRVVPMDLFHILEFLDVPYQTNPEEINRMYDEVVKGSHLLVFLLSDRKSVKRDCPAGGLYSRDPALGTCSYVRPAMDYKEMEDGNQFIVIDGPPDTGREDFSPSDPFYRLCRVLLPVPVIDSAGNLLPHAAAIMDWVYSRIVKERE